LRKKFSGATFVENALIIALVIIAAIGGLGYLGQSIREQLGFIFDEAAQRKNQIHHATESTLIENGKAEEDASRIANAAADAAAAAYRAALDAGDSPELANKAAAWAAYLTAYEQANYEVLSTFVNAKYAQNDAREAYYDIKEAYDSGNASKEDVDKVLQECVAAVEACKAAMNVVYSEDEDIASVSYAASEAAYKSAWEAYNGREPSTVDLIYDRVYSSTLDAATSVLSALRDSQNATLDVAAAARSVAENMAKVAQAACEDAVREDYAYLVWNAINDNFDNLLENAGAEQINFDDYKSSELYGRSIPRWGVVDATMTMFDDCLTGITAYRERAEMTYWAERMRNGD
jgi:Flp pilus assembly pilin Flp